MVDIKILITGAGSPGFPGIFKSLRNVQERKIKVIGADCRENTAGSVLADSFFKIFPAEDGRYLDCLVDLAKKEKANAILPLNTAELLKLSESKNVLKKEGIGISISKPGGLKIANNKYLLMKEIGGLVPAPEYHLARSRAEFLNAINVLGFPENKVCFKPPISNGSRGFRIINGNLDYESILLKEKPRGIEIDLEDILRYFDNIPDFPELLVMEYLPGREFSVDALAREGESLAVIPRIRDRIAQGISIETTLVEDADVIKYTKEIIEKLNLNGNVGFQFKEDEVGIPKLIECNPRIQGTVAANTFAGINLVYLGLKLALGEEVKIPKDVRWGSKIIRFWDEACI